MLNNLELDHFEHLELDHLALALLLSPQLEVFGSLDRSLQREEKLNHNYRNKYLLFSGRAWFFHLHTVHSILRTSFFVVFAFFLRIGFD